MRFSTVSAALVAALVGYGGTIALVLSAAQALGATPSQTVSWVFAICLAKGLGSAVLSTWTKVPTVLAWSTPGAALLAASSGIGMAEAAGAFALAGALILLTGLLRPIGRLVAAIPDPIAAGMLGGVLLPFCLAVPGHAVAAPGLMLPVVAVFVLVRLVNPSLAVLAALAAGLALNFTLAGSALPAISFALPRLEFLAPEWSWGVLLGLGLPLYLVTMAGQNLPGFAVQRAYGYTAPVSEALTLSGTFSTVIAFFCSHPINMAAITAAICMGDDVHPDRSQRWKVGIPYGVFWVLLALFGPVLLAFLLAMPRELIAGIAGLALIGPFLGAASGTVASAEHRFAGVATLVVTGSGVAVAGIGAAFWGLATGLLLHGLENAGKRFRN